MKMCKNEKGAITLFVLVSMLFLTMFLITIYTLSTNNEIAQRNVATKLKEKYSNGIGKEDEIYSQLLVAKAYDKNGNEIKDFSEEKFSKLEYLIDYNGWKLELKEQETISVEPYYIVIGDKEAIVKEYITILSKDEENVYKKELKFQNIEFSTQDNIKEIIRSEESEKSKIESIQCKEGCTLKIDNMASMFGNLTNLKSIDLSGLDTSNVKNMTSMFYGCQNLTKLTLGNKFNTSNVKYMANMFYNCYNLESLNIDDFTTINVEYMSSMFYGCSKLRELDVSGFDTKMVKTMESMFRNCTSLLSLDISNFETSTDTSLTGMYAMFAGCSNLKSLTLPLDKNKFNTYKVSNMANMFSRLWRIGVIRCKCFEYIKCY